MALEHQINEESFTGLDKSVQTHYEQHDDKGDYYLQAVGMVSKDRVSEFRENNIKLKQQGEKDQTVIDDLTLKLETANKGSDKDKIASLVEEGIGKRTEAMQKEHKTSLDEMTGRATKSEGALNSMLVGDAVQREAIAAGVKDTALEDVLTRAKKVFRVADGKAVPYDGEDVIYGKDGKTPMSVKDWLAGQAGTAPHLFKESKGGGADNKNKGGGATGKTMSRAEFDSRNATEKMEFVKSGGTLTD